MTMTVIGPLLVTFVLAQVQAPPPKPKPYEPVVGQAGKDVVWVPSTMEMVEKMLDIAKVTPQDVVMDLGSGDGRMIIAAAKRGAQAIGVEYTPEMVELSREKAKEAGVADKASFVQGDMYVADISKATVMALFLLPHNLDKLKDKFLALEPGSRIVLNTYAITGWEPDYKETMPDDCSSWCTILLHYVPARVAGSWSLPDGQLTLTQEFQMISGELVSGSQRTQITGKLQGNDISFTAGGVEYTGRVNGKQMDGLRTDTKQRWTATRTK
jgi:SAM-dependent methyltransferase